MRVIVTRPRREAQRWGQALAAAGHEVVALPLIEVAGLSDLAPLQQAWQRLGDYAAVMFVSANAVSYFFASKPAPTRTTIDLFATKTRAWATGPSTAAALLQAGVPAAHIDAPPSQGSQFDSEALWRVVAGQVRPGQRVLIARGDDGEPGAGDGSGGNGSGRDWLATSLTAAGARPEFVVTYRRRAPDWLAQEQALASDAAHDGSVWIFSSSQAVRNLQQQLPTQRWHQGRAVATHRRIADVARQAGFGTVQVSRPDPADLVASIELLR
jgi:uroporphyrinogen-III synthase